MKMLIFFGLLLAANAFALSPRDSWTRIFANPNAYYSTDYDNVFGQIGLSNVCLTRNNIQSIHPIEVCVEHEKEIVTDGEGGYYEFYTCKRTATSPITHSRAFNYNVCVDYIEVDSGDSARLECAQFATQRGYVPEVIEVTVWEEQQEYSSWPGFTKEYRIPSCSLRDQDQDFDQDSDQDQDANKRP